MEWLQRTWFYALVRISEMTYPTNI
jgi:hypothetical protein